MQQHMGTAAVSREMQQYIQACTECHNVCVTTVQHCLHLGGSREHFRLGWEYHGL